MRSVTYMQSNFVKPGGADAVCYDRGHAVSDDTISTTVYFCHVIIKGHVTGSVLNCKPRKPVVYFLILWTTICAKFAFLVKKIISDQLVYIAC